MTLFTAGAAVRVQDDWPEARGPVHIRTPHYLRGRPGVVLRHLGRFANPEDLAFARPAAALELYHVAFDTGTLWPGGGDQVGGEVVVEVYEPWLQPA